jgi:tRNA (5-methylaminomethyl-2-thiouridylate)-methyltransferase
MSKKVAMLLSGGVDSSVAMKLLLDQGYDVTAFYLKIWLEDELAFLGECPWEEDMDYVRAVCNKYNVPLQIINLQTEYLNIVVEYALKELRLGRTPSPDIWCNQHIKFGAFVSKIDDSYDFIASGHYALSEEKDSKFYLKRAVDPVKDQTYFLTYLSQEQLSRIIFPLGGFPKSQVREMAKEMDLPNKDRKDSQGICFLGKIRYPDFVKFHLGEKTGDIIDIHTNKVLGKHNGFWFHTIGQRSGLGLSGGPWFVVKKDTENNIVYVAHADVYEERDRKEFEVHDINWIPEKSNLSSLKVKLRHGPKMYDCQIEQIENGNTKVRLDQSDQGIAPGQYAIFYDGDYCIGGGVISE